MSTFTFGELAKELQLSREEGVSFEDKALTWNTADDVKEVVAAINNASSLHYLKLDGNTMGVDAAAAIGKALERHPELRKALWQNMFTRRLKTEIPQALKHLSNGLIVANAQLTVLDLSDNALGPNGMVGLEDLLRSRVCYTLNTLCLNNCGLGIGGGQMLSKALLDCHANSTAAGTPLKLKIFVTGRNRLEDDGAKAISKIFSTLKTLEEIVMPQNAIYHVGIAELAAGFRENPNLRVINLNDNTVTPKGAAHLADAFSFTPHLREINFGDCLLKTNGAYHFAEALEQNHKELEVVDLGFNEIGPDGGLVLASAMCKKPLIKKLNLDGNQFGYEGRERIKEVMGSAVNPSALESLDEDQSEGEEEGEDEDTDDGGEEEELYGDDHHNDTTEEADEDEDYDQAEYVDQAEETAYTTSTAFPNVIKLISPNETFNSYKSVTFGTDTGNTATTTTTTVTTTGATENEAYTVEAFCLSRTPCSLRMFLSLKEGNDLEAFKTVINQFTGDNYLLVLIFTALKCAHLAQSSSLALSAAISLCKEAFDYAFKTNQERRVLNYYLMQLGLLRCEEKFKSSYDLQSCRYALRETLNMQKIDSEYMKNTFNVFLKQLDV